MNRCLNIVVKNSLLTIKNKIVSRYLIDETNNRQSRSTDINILLNRVKMDKKKENRKKILFSAFTSIFLLLFGVFIF